jgi:hypothetical protein
LHEKHELASRSKISDQGSFEQKLDKLTIENKKLNDQLDAIKSDQKKSVEDLKRQHERERDLQKKKISEA